MDLDSEEQKKLFKEVLTTWLDERFKSFYLGLGKWVFRSIAAALFAAAVMFMLKINGWHK